MKKTDPMESLRKAIENVPEELREKVRIKFTFKDLMSFAMALGSDDSQSIGVILYRCAYTETPMSKVPEP